MTTPATWAGTPAGAVQFAVDGQPLGMPVPLDGNGMATSPTIATLAVGAHQATATFTGTGPFQPSNGGPASVSVVNAPITATVAPLPAATHTNSFNVQWSGQSDAGIASFDVYASVDGGPLAAWLTATTQTQASYTGMDGHGYGFAVVATNPFGDRSPARRRRRRRRRCRPPPQRRPRSPPAPQWSRRASRSHSPRR